MRTLVLALCGLLIMGLPAASQEVPNASEQVPPVWSGGEGTKLCEAWTADRGTEMHAMDLDWALGFMAGRNYGFPASAQAHYPDYHAVETFIDKVCAAHPFVTIFDAANAAVEAGGGPKVTEH